MAYNTNAPSDKYVSNSVFLKPDVKQASFGLIYSNATRQYTTYRSQFDRSKEKQDFANDKTSNFNNYYLESK